MCLLFLSFALSFWKHIDYFWYGRYSRIKLQCSFQVEVVEGVAGEEDHHDEQEEHGEENAEAEGQHDEHDEDGTYNVHHAH